MQAKYRLLSLALSAAAVSLLLPQTTQAQSIPPGRVTHRQFQSKNKAQEGNDNKSNSGEKPTVANPTPAPANGQPADANVAPAVPNQVSVDAKGNPVDAKGNLIDAKGNPICRPIPPKDPSAPDYAYPKWFPLWGKNCHTDAEVEYFFSEGDKLFSAAEQAQYLYNAQQSASVISADLLTATFQPGLQAVLAGSVTAGSSNGSTTTTTTTTNSAFPRDTTTTTSSSSTDSAATAISKLESGGDFNLRFVLPMLWASKGSASVTGNLTPNVGFTVNGLTAQNTITDSTEYSLNVPAEFYGQLTSTANSSTQAALFVDLKPQGEFISKTVAAKLGPSVPTAMFLGEASAGIEFAQKVRVSMQYVYGTASIFKSSSTATPTASTPTSKIGGFHLVVSFSK